MQPRKRLDHETPFWIGPEADFFVTICAEPKGRNQLCHPDLGAAILHSVRRYNEHQRWYCDLIVLMPDHLHMTVSIPREKTIFQVIGLWKRGVTKSHGIIWQRNFFDHRMRNDENVQRKSDYILNNPVRAGLIDDPMKWPYTWLANRD